MVLDASFVNTLQYKVRIKGKVEQSRERGSPLPYNKGPQLYFLYIYLSLIKTICVK